MKKDKGFELKNPEILNVLDALKEIKKETEIFEAGEKEKYKVGLILKESIDELRRVISSFEQLTGKGYKINSEKRNNMRAILLILGNLLDLVTILGIGNHSGVDILKSQLDAKIKHLKKPKKRRVKVPA